MMVVDSGTGKIIATLPIGKGTDAAAFDPTDKLAFSSNRDGTLTVIQEAEGLELFRQRVAFQGGGSGGAT